MMCGAFFLLLIMHTIGKDVVNVFECDSILVISHTVRIILISL